MKSLANEFFKTMEDGARTHQAAHADAYELVATGIKDEQDVARQIEIVEQMIARNVQAIVARARRLARPRRRRPARRGGRHRGRQHRQPLRRRRPGRAEARDPVRRPRQPQGRQAGRRGRRAPSHARRSDRHPRRRAERVQRHPAEARASRTRPTRRASGSSARRRRSGRRHAPTRSCPRSSASTPR